MRRALAILLVDDDESDVELVARALNGGRVPCRLSVVRNGLQALDYLHRRGNFGEAARPDLIFTDINMPGMDGKRLLEKIQQDDDLKTIPTVMLTSSAAPRDVLDCYARNVSFYVVKPFDAQTFIDVVRRVVTFLSAVPVLPSRVALGHPHC
jgi:CheY-like chemotaxis protein